ncbi:MAG TPA: BON domain-containing protein [Edaphobacter sp.]
MPRLTARRMASGLLALSLVTIPVLAQQQQQQQQEAPLPPGPPTFSSEDMPRVTEEIRRTLARLTNFGVFDWITFGIHGKSVILNGYASRPSLRSDAERAVRRINGVENVENNIEVLPNSFNDDRIRAAVYDRIYTQPALRRYNRNMGGIARATRPHPNVALRAGGVTNAPPIGWHAIHIIVRNGHVQLFGFVDRESDANIAFIQANGTPGVFSVTNNLDFPTRPETSQ